MDRLMRPDNKWRKIMIFVSYCWEQAEYADRVVQFMEARHFSVLQDKKEIKVTDSISEFMNKIGTSDFAILLISQAYLKSYNCLYEAFIAYDRNLGKNIVPVVFKDANVFDSTKQIEYIGFWSKRLSELVSLVGTLPSYKAIEVSKKIRQIEKYSSFLGDFMSYIQDTNCIIVDNDSKKL